jgi:glycerol-3-phosphate dehydrogenase
MTLRDQVLEALPHTDVDVIIVGGGINGAVSAAALQARGLKVALVDRGDFAGVTSSSSSYLAWGGIKYLESYEFGLVRKLCTSRNHLLRAMPSQVKEIRFFVSLEPGFRHGRLFLYAGALFYWFIGSFFTRRPRLLTRGTIAREESVVDVTRSVGGFEYSDAILPDLDARFVWSFVRRALQHGCLAANYVESRGARFTGDRWHVDLVDVRTGRAFTVRSKAMINAAGPWVDAHNQLTSTTTSHQHVFSKGIHLIVPRVTPNERVLTFFADDGRLFFVIPMGERTCVGTTDTRVPSPDAHVTDDDRAFVLENINKRLKLKHPLTPADVISERCGVRPLVVSSTNSKSHGKDWFQLSRKHVLDVDAARRHVSIFGGKLTDCVNIGEEIARVVADLGVPLPAPGAPWYGEPGDDVRARYAARAAALGLGALDDGAPADGSASGRPGGTAGESVAARLWRRYGDDALLLLDDIERDPRAKEPALPGAPDLRCEVAFAGTKEMVTTLDDYLRRRTRLLLSHGREALLASPALPELCALLFGDDAAAREREFRAAPPAGGLPPPSTTTTTATTTATQAATRA